MLLVRIAESKALLKQKISDGELLNLVSLISQVNEAFKEVLRLAFRDARGHVYEHLFIDGIYDWYWEKDGVLNDAIKKALWYLNQYDFEKITRDVFKHVYQFHMDRKERKQVGEYYTPDSVVDYILDKVGYVSTADLRQTHLLDPGCGSGTFLVEAVNRLKDLRVRLSPREILYMAAGRPGTTRELGSIFGFDIVPFAAYLAEANLLFQLIDEIRSAKSEDLQFKIDRFQVYRTNSLQPPDQVASMDDWVVGIETAEVSRAKQIKYDFIVGNPPYVEVENLRDKKAEIASYLKDMFPALLIEENLGRLELYIAFLAMGVKLLNEGGRLGFITSAKFLATENGRWVRRLILEKCAIEEIVDLMRVTVFPGQAVYPIILILRRESDKSARHNNKIRVKVVLKDKLALLDVVKNIACEEKPTIPSEADYLAYTVPQSRFEQSLDFVFEIYASEPIEAIREKILHGKAERRPLTAIADTRQGVIAGGEAKWLQRLDRLGIGRFGANFTVDERVLDSLSATERALYKKMVNGDSVGHFESDWKKTRMYLCYDDNSLTAPRERDVFEQPEKALLKAKTKYLQASYDNEKLYCTNDVYIARWQPEPSFKISMKYFVALLNSLVLDFCYKLRHAEYIRGGWFVRYAFVFDQLPIVEPTETQEKKLTGLVDQLISAKRASDSAERTASSLSALLRASKISLVTAGLSRLITNRENLQGRVERISRRESVLFFDRRRRTFIECASQEAAEAITRLLAEDFGRIKGQMLNDVLDRVRLPKDTHDLETVLRLEKKLLKVAKSADESFESLLEKLNYEVSLLYGLTDKEYLDLKNFLRLITTEEQGEVPESNDTEADERADESLDSHLSGPSEVT
jgi:type I restriction-modification system DNA methylase subunit